MKRIMAVLTVVLLVFSLTACQIQDPVQTDPIKIAIPGSNGPSKPVTDDHTHTMAEEPQTVDDPVTGYCGNTITTICLDGREYSFMGSDSVNLTDIAINLKYDPMKICRCAPEFTVTTETGTAYGVNLTQGYVRCEEGQADLTLDQIDRIQEIIDNQT